MASHTDTVDDKRENCLVPQKVQPAVFDDRGVQLQREEVVVEDSDRTAGVDIQEDQRSSHEARSLHTSCRSLISRGGRVRGRECRLHHQNNQRCQPQGGPGGNARWGFGHLLGLEDQRGSVRAMRLKGCKEERMPLQSSMAVLYFNPIDLDLSSCLVVSPPLPPAPLSIFGSCAQERTPGASLPGSWSQKLGGGEEAAPPL